MLKDRVGIFEKILPSMQWTVEEEVVILAGKSEEDMDAVHCTTHTHSHILWHNQKQCYYCWLLCVVWNLQFGIGLPLLVFLEGRKSTKQEGITTWEKADRNHGQQHICQHHLALNSFLFSTLENANHVLFIYKAMLCNPFRNKRTKDS